MQNFISNLATIAVKLHPTLTTRVVVVVVVVVGTLRARQTRRWKALVAVFITNISVLNVHIGRGDGKMAPEIRGIG
jgi:hypothetical protein